MSDDQKRYAEQLAGFGVKVGSGGHGARPNDCGGALLKEFNREGMAFDRRITCSSPGGDRNTLCSRCAELERENRRELRERLQAKKPGASSGKAGRGEYER